MWYVIESQLFGGARIAMTPVTTRIAPTAHVAPRGSGRARAAGSRGRRPRKAHTPIPPARAQLTASHAGVR